MCFKKYPAHQTAALARNNQQPKLARLCLRLGYLSNRPLKNDLGCRYGVKKTDSAASSAFFNDLLIADGRPALFGCGLRFAISMGGTFVLWRLFHATLRAAHVRR